MAHWQFYYPKRYAFYPPDYESPGLGGSESALVLLTRQLALRGHQVEVFNCCFRPGTYDGVRWRMTWELPTTPLPDMAVSVRYDEGLWPDNRSAGHHCFWMLDDRPRGPAAFLSRYGSAGTVVTASYAMENRLALAGLMLDVVRIPLPIEFERYRPGKRRHRACLFASMPNRGLDVTLKIWPEIRKAVPDSELWVTSGWLLWGFTNSEADDRWKGVLGNEPLPEGVKIFGSVSKEALCRLQETAWMGLYPCRFPEMFCLAAAESAAAETPLVTSDFEALSERVRPGESGVLIPGSIESKDVQGRFVEETVSLLEDSNRRDRLGAGARESTSAYAVDSVAISWEALLNRV